MASLNGFNAEEVEPAAKFDPIPAGRYQAIITDSEQKPTKAGTGHYLQLTFQIQEGTYKGRILWARLNLDNPNATAVQIARAELSAICRAVGVTAPGDSVELHNLPLMITVKVRRRVDTGDLQNEIGGYSSRSEKSTPASATQSKKDTPPWQRTSQAG
ncbi:MAG: DUF669 domain-containing protein [Planctomycetaceae bacterium]|nr:DUF669 domain-containing protein [Planctomycetaceae bacterium]